MLRDMDRIAISIRFMSVLLENALVIDEPRPEWSIRRDINLACVQLFGDQDYIIL